MFGTFRVILLLFSSLLFGSIVCRSIEKFATESDVGRSESVQSELTKEFLSSYESIMPYFIRLYQSRSIEDLEKRVSNLEGQYEEMLVSKSTKHSQKLEEPNSIRKGKQSFDTYLHGSMNSLNYSRTAAPVESSIQLELNVTTKPASIVDSSIPETSIISYGSTLPKLDSRDSAKEYKSDYVEEIPLAISEHELIAETEYHQSRAMKKFDSELPNRNYWIHSKSVTPRNKGKPSVTTSEESFTKATVSPRRISTYFPVFIKESAAILSTELRFTPTEKIETTMKNKTKTTAFKQVNEKEFRWI